MKDYISPNTFVNKGIYDLKLHETCIAYDGVLFIMCTRVHNGWIYNSFDKGTKILGSTFVPYTQTTNAPPMTEKEVVDFMEESKELMDDLSK